MLELTLNSFNNDKNIIGQHKKEEQILIYKYQILGL